MSIVDGVPVAMAPPAGYVVNFDHPQRQTVGATYAVIGVGNVLALLFLAQRFFVKLKVRHKVGIDDACVTFAWICSVTIQSLIAQGYADGFIGVHLWELPLPKFVLFLKKGLYVYPIIYAIPSTLTKTALLLFYVQLGNRQLSYLLAIYFTMFVVLGSGIGILFANAFACSPVKKFWDLTLTTGSCIDRLALYKATAVLGIITDVMVFAIPIPMVAGLQMSRRKKAGVILVFAVGSATVITSIVRLVLLIKSFSSADQPWTGGPITMWICIESNLLIICSCLPTLRQAISTIVPRFFGDSSVGKSSNVYELSGKGDASGGKSGALNSKRGQYQSFGDGADYHTDTRVQSGKVSQSGPWNWSSHTEDNRGTFIDDDSEKGIVQTRAVEIQYERRGY